MRPLGKQHTAVDLVHHVEHERSADEPGEKATFRRPDEHERRFLGGPLDGGLHVAGLDPESGVLEPVTGRPLLEERPARRDVVGDRDEDVGEERDGGASGWRSVDRVWLAA